jgi:alkylhydroperoxidase family enzyme
VSSKASGIDVDIDVVAGRENAREEIPCADALIEFAEAAIGGDDGRLATAREALSELLGDEAVVDAAGVIAAFNMNTRIADAAGIPLDEPAREAREAIAARLDVRRYEE